VCVCVCLFSGDGQSMDVTEIAARMNVLNKDIAQLEHEEQQLDKDRVIVDQYIRQLTKDLANQK